MITPDCRPFTYADGETECMEFRRESEAYGDVVLSVQASRYHYCEIGPEHKAIFPSYVGGRLGCAHIPLEFYASVEIALFYKHSSSRNWITKPSEIGIEGFDDLWNGDDVAGWVPLARVGQLQVALKQRQNRG